MVKSPLTPVTAPSRVPSTETCASGRPRPPAASVTRPRTAPVVAWEKRREGDATSASASAARALRRAVMTAIRDLRVRVLPARSRAPGVSAAWIETLQGYRIVRCVTPGQPLKR